MPNSATRLGAYEVVVRPDGHGAVRHVLSGETMHSVNNPAEEAHRLYIEQPKITSLAQESAAPLIIWDVGLGAATNAMACIQSLEALADIKREVQLVSFENDLDPLRLAASNPALFAHTRHAAPTELLATYHWRSNTHPIEWKLLEGDFLARIDAAPLPDLIWYDPFSYKTNAELWSFAAFERVLAATAGKSTALYTYSASTAVRATMLMAGWFVGRGYATGPKNDTTVAYSPAAVAEGLGENLLDAAWLQRWKRSDAQGPIGDGPSDAKTRVENHPQFR
jgi:queuine tRNA-ribosyltransferase